MKFFRPRHTLFSVLQELANGLQDGTVALCPSASSVPHRIYLQDWWSTRSPGRRTSELRSWIDNAVREKGAHSVALYLKDHSDQLEELLQVITDLALRADENSFLTQLDQEVRKLEAKEYYEELFYDDPEPRRRDGSDETGYQYGYHPRGTSFISVQ